MGAASVSCLGAASVSCVRRRRRTALDRECFNRRCVALTCDFMAAPSHLYGRAQSFVRVQHLEAVVTLIDEGDTVISTGGGERAPTPLPGNGSHPVICMRDKVVVCVGAAAAILWQTRSIFVGEASAICMCRCGRCAAASARACSGGRRRQRCVSNRHLYGILQPVVW